MWTLENLLKFANSTQVEINGKWVPARPVNYQYRTLKERFKEAYAVFKGNAESFTWPENQ